MTDFRLQSADVEFPRDAETREARHELLASFLGAYADGELPPETRSQIDAHLIGCTRCQRELDVHKAVRERLGNEPVPPATSALRERIAAGIRQAPAPVFAEPTAPAGPATRRRGARTASVALAVAGAIIVAAAFMLRSDARARSNPQPVQLASSVSVPLFSAVLNDYRHVMASDLPGRARDLVAVRGAFPFDFAPLSNPALRLLGAWTTQLDGEPAAVLAYRWNDRVVLQYFVSEDFLFRSPDVRASLAQKRAVSTNSGGQGMLLWAEPEYGSVLVGDLQPGEFAALRSAGKAR